MNVSCQCEIFYLVSVRVMILKSVMMMMMMMMMMMTIMKVVIMCVWMIMMIMDYESSDYVCMDVPRAQ